MVLGCRDQVAKLSKFSLEGRLMEEFDKINVIVGVTEVLFQEMVNAGFKQKGVIDGNHANPVLAEPAWLTATSDGGVHNVIRNQKECLQLKNNQ